MPLPAKSCMLAINGLRISQTVLQNRQLKMTHLKQLMPNPLVVIQAAPLTHAEVVIVSKYIIGSQCNGALPVHPKGIFLKLNSSLDY